MPGPTRRTPQNKQAEILLYDLIGEDWLGEGFTAKNFAETLKELDLREGDELVLRVNSPGGSVWDGYAIYNQLAAVKAKTIARVEGIALSAASFIIQAADEIEVAEASFVMIHRAWGFTVGNAEDHLKAATELEKFDGTIADIYAKRAEGDRDKWLEAMSVTTWYTGAEAIEAGLADRLIEADEEEELDEAPAAKFARIISRFQHVPAALKVDPPRELAPAALAELTEIRKALAEALGGARAEGRKLNAANRQRLNQIRSLAQEVLDSDSQSDDTEDKARAQRQAAVLMAIETDLAQVATEELCH